LNKVLEENMYFLSGGEKVTEDRKAPICERCKREKQCLDCKLGVLED
jgi:hypothetical protein